MRLLTDCERREAQEKIHALAERLRAEMTPDERARVLRLPRQGARETARRRKQMAANLRKQSS